MTGVQTCALPISLKKLAALNKTPISEIGETGGSRLIIGVDWSCKKCSKKLNISLEELHKIWSKGVKEYV